jgi:hypothetical protein
MQIIIPKKAASGRKTKKTVKGKKKMNLDESTEIRNEQIRKFIRSDAAQLGFDYQYKAGLYGAADLIGTYVADIDDRNLDKEYKAVYGELYKADNNGIFNGEEFEKRKIALKLLKIESRIQENRIRAAYNPNMRAMDWAYRQFSTSLAVHSLHLDHPSQQSTQTGETGNSLREIANTWIIRNVGIL